MLHKKESVVSYMSKKPITGLNIRKDKKEELTMSGHSKWHNIQAKKGKADAARGKILQKWEENCY